MSAMFSKRHYEAIARVIASHDDPMVRSQMATLFSDTLTRDTFTRDNERFNRRRFVEACRCAA